MLKRIANHLTLLALSASSIYFCFRAMIDFSLIMDTTSKKSIDDAIMFGFNILMLGISLATSALFASMMEKDR